MDLKDQLSQLFPEHIPQTPDDDTPISKERYWIQDAPIICKYEKRKGKPVTLLEGYTGTEEDFKTLTKDLKQLLSVGGSSKNDVILIQGDYRDRIMDFLKEKGFAVKRVGG
ncbi:MAG: translation initiation factor [Bacteroidota bacterium]